MTTDNLHPITALPVIGDRIYVRQADDTIRPAVMVPMSDVWKINPALGLHPSADNEPYIDEVIRGFKYTDEAGGADICIMYFPREGTYNSRVFTA